MNLSDSNLSHRSAAIGSRLAALLIGAVAVAMPARASGLPEACCAADSTVTVTVSRSETVTPAESVVTTTTTTTTTTTFADDYPLDEAFSRPGYAIDYKAEAIFTAAGKEFAPYFLVSNRHGILTQANNALLRLGVSRDLDLSQRFSYGFGASFVTGISSSTGYSRYNPDSKSPEVISRRPSSIFLQELYGVVKYRAVYLEAGLREHSSALLSAQLSSGDLVESGNSRPIPQVRAGFLDFVDVPFTQGWLQIQGVISYGKFTDNGWMKSHYNYYNSHINLGALYTYKRCYFRIAPRQQFSFTLGMQTAGMFGGTTTYYRQGVLYKTEKWSRSISTFFKMFLPLRGQGSEYYEGNSLGSWDLMARYRFANGATLKAYLQKPFEDGSGIGWLNGFDGLWGVQYTAANPNSILSEAVVEYLDFRNQSGPIHWSPDDNPGTTLGSHTDGGDQYYNNAMSNAYMNYGMSIGTPFLPAPIYNLDGYPCYVHNRIRGFHIGLAGNIIPQLRYRLLCSWREGWGDSRIPTTYRVHDTSVMAEARYDFAGVPGLSVKGAVAYDNGNMFSSGFGGEVGVTYSGTLFF